VVALKGILDLAGRYKTNIESMLTWAFEFEGQPWFDGLRTLATNGVDKPVLNVFRMAGLMRGNRVKTESTGALGLDAILAAGVQQAPDVDAMAARGEREVTVLAWNYHDDDVPGPAAKVKVEVAGLPATAKRALLKHYRIDREHSNAYTVWQAMGSPQSPAPKQYAKLEAAGQLQLLESPRWLWCEGGRAEVEFTLPRQGVSLLVAGW
jgi:xylan 1,4-beta-xylosidase